MSPKSGLTTSPVGRFLKLGGMVGRVGSSLLAQRLVELALRGAADPARSTEALVKNAQRVVETLGELRGGAMKVGQMLSLQRSFLPPEVADVLATLQGSAPAVPAEVMRYEVEGQLPDFDDLFAELDAEPFAAASIGQVHRGRLRDGRLVAVKIQYPLIREVVQADLGNLKRLLGSLVALFVKIDFDPLWEEIRDRLEEELDYRHEAAAMVRAAALHDGVGEVVIPRVVEEASTDRVLTMAFEPGLPPELACTERFPAELRSRWGWVLLEFVLRGLFEHRYLHVDPNLANFGFREDGSLVVYDFGCMKEVPEVLARGYARLTVAGLEERRQAIPGVLAEMGITKRGGAPISLPLIDPYVDLFEEIFRPEPPYRFGEDEELYDRMLRLGMESYPESTDLAFPRDLVFLNRTLGGHFGNLCRLEAEAPWRELAERYARPRA